MTTPMIYDRLDGIARTVLRHGFTRQIMAQLGLQLSDEGLHSQVGVALGFGAAYGVVMRTKAPSVRFLSRRPRTGTT